MKYKLLLNFIEKKMRMSHIYQTVMIKTLLKGRGSGTVNNIAKKLLSFDMAQIEYYEDVTKNMVGTSCDQKFIV